MTPPIIRRACSVVLGATALVLTSAGCSAPTTEPPAAETVSPTPAPSATPATSTPTPTETPDAAPLTCDTMISARTVQDFTALGWSFEEQPFVIGDVTLPDGLLCFWADYSVPSDHGQLYGWSPITLDQATRAQSSLLSQGWRREDGPDGIYLTEDPEFAMGTDDAGYGMTYLFADGWVAFADTREGLILIDGAR